MNPYFQLLENSRFPTNDDNSGVSSPGILPVVANWAGFFAYIQTTTVWTYLNVASASDLQINTVATFLRILLSEAATGRPDQASIQGGLAILWPGLSAPYRAEITSGMTTFNLPLTVPT